jgi:hypothetical protein
MMMQVDLTFFLLVFYKILCVLSDFRVQSSALETRPPATPGGDLIISIKLTRLHLRL